MKHLLIALLALIPLAGCQSGQKIDPAQVSALTDLTLTVSDVVVDTAHANGDLSDADYQKAKLAEAAAKAINEKIKAASTQPSK